jgi:cytochrome c-type biogenesis protein CcmH
MSKYRIMRYRSQGLAACRGALARLLLLAVVALTASVSARAVLPDEVLKDATLEARARALSQELRCMVCQNQSIDDSDAPLARDLRVLVRERIAAGDSNEQVRDFLVARYGEFVLLKPRFTPHTLLLWLLPPLALIGGGLALWFYSRRRANTGSPTDPALLHLTEQEEARLQHLLAADAPDKQA